jgi:hypothetical protein
MHFGNLAFLMNGVFIEDADAPGGPLAFVSLPPPDDRLGLERLCRYGLRAPFSLDRLSLDPDGRVRYRLHRPWPTSEGQTGIVLEPVAFLRRLAALNSAGSSRLASGPGRYVAAAVRG